VAKRDTLDQVIIKWPSGRVEDFKNVLTGKRYEAVEGKGLSAST
jgi:hypothetical protein